ncbi:MAG TPA: sugar porter family MFS transporter [Rubrobacter sp.]|jgi:SP family sugar:H+ symporter-like MFS transporter|nr:sugar porter family MFS transporter [Rubrobacter sp.]
MSSQSAEVGRVGSNKLVYFFGALGGLLFGYDTGVIAGAILFINEDLGLSPFTSGLVVSSLLVGAMIGAAFAGPIADATGRRKLVLVAAIIFAIGAIGAALATSAGLLILFRFVLGLAVGAASLIVPLYLAEVAPTEIRGAVASLNQLMIVTGILVAYIANSALAGAEAWRWMIALAVIPSLLLFLGMLFMPETPRWLVSKDRDEEAREVLRRTRDETAVEAEMSDIKRVEGQEEGGLGELLASWVRPALLVGMGLAIFQQIIGINTIIYYAPTTLTNVGFGNSAAILANAGIGVINVTMTLVAIRFIDRVGRKPLLLLGAAGMALSLAILGLTSLLLPEPSGVSLVGIITLVCLALFIAAFAVSWGPIVWVMLGEIFPLKVRGSAMAVATVLLWGANFVVSLSFPVLLEALGIGWLFLGYSLIGLAALFFVRSFVTETKGRSLEKIESDLRERAGA